MMVQPKCVVRVNAIQTVDCLCSAVIAVIVTPRAQGAPSDYDATNLIMSSQIFVITSAKLLVLDREILFLLHLPKKQSVSSEKPFGGALHILFSISETNHEN